MESDIMMTETNLSSLPRIEEDTVDKLQEIDPNKLEQLKDKLTKSPLTYDYVEVGSEQFRQFIMELANPKMKEDKKIYDVWLTWWQFLTPYKLKLHQVLGHEGIKGNYIRNQEDFMVLAKAYGRLFNEDTGVTLFAAYDKSNSIKNEWKLLKEKKTKKDTKLDRKENELNGLSTLDVMDYINYNSKQPTNNSLNRAQLLMNLLSPPLSSTTGTKSKSSEIGLLNSDQEKILFTTQMISMIQMINSNITNFKYDISKRLNEILTQFNVNSAGQSNLSSAKLTKVQTEKENIELIKINDEYMQPESFCGSAQKSNKKNILIENLKSFTNSEIPK